jgi:site-specific recombinase XerD
MTASQLQKIDIHRASARYAGALARFTTDTSLSQANKTYILEFLAACSLGKTILDSQKKRIKPKRLLKYLYTLRLISTWLGNSDLKQVTQQEMEQFITRLETNQLTVMRSGKPVPVQYADWSRRDVKVTLRKFYKWLLGSGSQTPPLVSWFDTHIDKALPASLSMDEIRRCAEFASSAKGKALCWTLFETGARAEEFLNVRIRDVKPADSHYLITIDYPKTFRRSPPVYEAAPYLAAWLSQHPNRHDPAAQLFPMSYAALSKFLKRLGCDFPKPFPHVAG